jgi:hypothetical protein
MTATADKIEANKKLARDYIGQVVNQHNPGNDGGLDRRSGNRR